MKMANSVIYTLGQEVDATLDGAWQGFLGLPLENAAKQFVAWSFYK